MKITTKNSSNSYKAACFLVTALTSSVAIAELEVTPEIEVQLRFDDNVFLLADEESTAEINGNDQRSDLILDAIASGSGKYEGTWHNFQVDAQAFRRQYSDFDFLSFTGGKVNTKWSWNISPRWDTELRYVFVKDQSSFSDENLAQGDIFNENRVTGKVAYKLNQAGDLYLKSSFKTRNYDVRDALENDRYDFSLGYIRYTQLKNFYGIEISQADGEYPSRLGQVNAEAQVQEYTENAIDAFIKWRPGQNSVFDAKIGFIDRQHNDQVSNFDYSGITYDFRYLWNYSSRTEITAQLSKQVRDTENSITAFNRDERLKIGAKWRYAEHIVLTSSITLFDSDFVQANGNRKDFGATLDLGAIYEFRVRSSLGFNLRARNRTSNRDLSEFDNAVALISYKYKL